MADLTKREYHLAPEIGNGGTFKCVSCARDIPKGYPFVSVTRDVTNATASINGVAVADMQCVYCDPTPTLPSLDG